MKPTNSANNSNSNSNSNSTGKSKTLCMYYKRSGFCKDGDRCRFTHVYNDNSKPRDTHRDRAKPTQSLAKSRYSNSSNSDSNNSYSNSVSDSVSSQLPKESTSTEPVEDVKGKPISKASLLLSTIKKSQAINNNGNTANDTTTNNINKNDINSGVELNKNVNDSNITTNSQIEMHKPQQKEMILDNDNSDGRVIERHKTVHVDSCSNDNSSGALSNKALLPPPGLSFPINSNNSDHDQQHSSIGLNNGAIGLNNSSALLLSALNPNALGNVGLLPPPNLIPPPHLTPMNQLHPFPGNSGTISHMSYHDGLSMQQFPSDNYNGIISNFNSNGDMANGSMNYLHYNLMQQQMVNSMNALDLGNDKSNNTYTSRSTDSRAFEDLLRDPNDDIVNKSQTISNYGLRSNTDSLSRLVESLPDNKVVDVTKTAQIASALNLSSLTNSANSKAGSEQKKSKALLSLLKAKAGSSLNQPFSPFQLAENIGTSHDGADDSDITNCHATTDSATTPANVLKTPVKRVNISDEDNLSTPVTNKKAGDNAKLAATATPKKNSSYFRSTKGKIGTLNLLVRFHSKNEEITCRDGFSMRPGNYMTVEWKINADKFHELLHNYKANPVDPDRESFPPEIVVALVRYGSNTNSACIISKAVDLSPRGSRLIHEYGHDFLVGRLQFHAPKAAGQFVFRVFDQSMKERVQNTLAHSVMFTVDLMDQDVASNLSFVLESLRDSNTIQKLKGVTPLPSILKGIRSIGKANNSSSCSKLLEEVMEIILQLIQESCNTIDEGIRRKRERSNSMASLNLATLENDLNDAFEVDNNMANSTIDSDAKESGTADESQFWSKYKLALKTHADVIDVLDAVYSNKIVWELLSEDYQRRTTQQNANHCPILNRYFLSEADMQFNRQEEFGFAPALADSDATISPTSKVLLNMNIDELLPKLLPSSDFAVTRNQFCARLQYSLTADGSFPPGTEIAMYGSSANNFGSPGADIDLCMIFPTNFRMSNDDKLATIEKLGEFLSRIGMVEVKTRPTARIPIVQFQDPLLGFECDISLKNPLALRNTALLRTYSLIDPRVRSLAFIIKHWAKARHLNSPGNGTLSSYGYVLCMLHFLQHRTPPLVPNLQRIPPGWDGKSDYESRTASRHQRLPVEPIVQSADNIPCNTYFYTPPVNNPTILQELAERNTESVGELLIEFFRYYAWRFDYRKNVISVHHTSPPNKVDKAEVDCWPMNDRLSIEDPFEVWYDVAHVIKGAQMNYLKREFLRAYTLAYRMCKSENSTGETYIDLLPSKISPSEFITLLLEKSEIPSFIRDKGTNQD